MMRRLLAVVFALSLAGPAGAAPDEDLTRTGRVGPDGIERLAQVLRGYRANQVAQAALRDANLRKAIEDIVKRFPNEPPEKYADRLKTSYSNLPADDQFRLTTIVEDEQARRAAASQSAAPLPPPQIPNPPPSPQASDPTKNIEPITPSSGPASSGGQSPESPQPDAGQAAQPAPSETPPPGVTNAQAKQFGAVAGWWRKNVGPLDATPAVKDVITDVIKTATPASGEGPLAGLFPSDDAPDAPKAGDWFERHLTAGDFKLTDLGSFLSGGTQAADVSVPAGGTGFAAGGSLLLPLLAAAALGLGWYFWRTAPARRARRAARYGLGPWPLDPRRLATREELIRAFEYLSLKTLGPAAAHAHHVALTTGLRDRHPTAPDAADELGALYAVARYAPADDPFPADGLPAARAAFGRLGEGPA